jgi:hypothetical protein
MPEVLIFFFIAAGFLFWQLLSAGLGESFEMVESDRATMTYKIHRRGQEPETKTIYLTVCYFSMSTSEMEWTNARREEINDAT